MKIRILTSLVIQTGPNTTRPFKDGDVFMHPDKAEAQKLIAAGYAEAVSEKGKE